MEELNYSLNLLNSDIVMDIVIIMDIVNMVIKRMVIDKVIDLRANILMDTLT